MDMTNPNNDPASKPDKSMGTGREDELQVRLKLEQELENLRNVSEEAAKHYDLMLSQKDLVHTEQLNRLEEIYTNSWRWRIGNIAVEFVIYCMNFVKNPVRFLTHKDYRGTWKGYNNQRRQAKLIQSRQKDSPAQNNKAGDALQAKLQHMMLPPVKRIDNKPVIAAIFDEFTTACFLPECTLITFRPDNWKEKLEQQTPEAILVESAWSGNQGSWQYKIAKYHRNMGDELSELVTWAKEHKIPAIFWNKEDPPNFDRFIEKASLFDYIFTSDQDCIPRYKERIQHDRIFSLPFAAQPAIHNPVGETPRLHQVCFAGTYHADEYLDRQNDMEIILNPSLEYGLHIYDRNFGSVGPGSERFRFPDKYQPFIKGRLNYQEMLKAYHQYKVFLNVNSVKESPTMFSRRVFELLAVGTPVISTYSKGIVELLGDSVFITESEADTRRHLDLLLNDRRAWIRASVKGIRKVMESHTYDKRLEQVLTRAGIQCNPSPLPDINLLIRVKDAVPAHLAEDILKQSFKPKIVILISEKELTIETFEQFSTRLSPISVVNLIYHQDHLARMIRESAPAAYYAFWHPTNWYGPDYLKDYALAVKYSHAPCIGKSNYFVFEGGKMREENTEKHFMLTHNVLPSTLLIKSEILSSFNMELINNPNGIYKSLFSNILSTDPLNFVKNEDEIRDRNGCNVETYFG
jgi:spore maturation protein CgeB